MKSSLSRGFTVIELLMVVAIIGVLAAIVVINAKPFRDRATGIEAASWAQTAELILEQYRVACGQYPPQTNNDPGLPYDAVVGCASGTSLGSFAIEPERANLASVQYFPIARDVDPETCVGYHLGIELEDATDARLSEDADVSTFALPAGFTACLSAGAGYPPGISGTDPTYDLIRPAALKSAF